MDRSNTEVLTGGLTVPANNSKLKNKEKPMAKGQSLQDPFLNALRKERVPVSIYLVNGIKLQGQMVYKHAISTVVPARNVRLATEEGAAAETPAE